MAIVLVAEESAIIRCSLAEALSDCGYGVLEARNQEEAVRAVSAPIQLLLTDHTPELNGIELAKRLQRTQPHITRVIFSAYDCNEISWSPLFDSCLQKPLNPRVVAAAVSALLS